MKYHLLLLKLSLLVVALIIVWPGCGTMIETKSASPPDRLQVRETTLREKRIGMIGVVDEKQTSIRPSIALAFVADEMEHPPFTQMVEGEITTMLQNTERFQLVERDAQLVSQILGEQRYQNLVMTDKAVELGGHLGADYVYFVNIHSAKVNESLLSKVATIRVGKGEHEVHHLNYGMVMDLHILEVATGGTAFSASYKVKAGSLMSQEVDAPYREQWQKGVVATCNRMMREIRRQFPLRGQVIEIISHNQVGINLGTKHGLRKKQKLRVFRKLSITEPIQEIAEIQAITVIEEGSIAKIKHLANKASIQVGDLVIGAD